MTPAADPPPEAPAPGTLDTRSTSSPTPAPTANSGQGLFDIDIDPIDWEDEPVGDFDAPPTDPTGERATAMKFRIVVATVLVLARYGLYLGLAFSPAAASIPYVAGVEGAVTIAVFAHSGARQLAANILKSITS
jgi:hypothetical protein